MVSVMVVSTIPVAVMSVTVGGAGGFTVSDTGTVTSKLVVPSLYLTFRLPVISVELFTVGRPNVTVTAPLDSAPEAVTLAVLRVESGAALTKL